MARGEVHALLGENGAGKTTLMRIAYGLVQPESGEIRVNGALVRIRSPRDAIAAGVGMVTQHFSLVRPMSVAENLALGRGSGLRMDTRRARDDVQAAAERFGMRVDPDARVEDLSVGEQQRVEILKALVRDTRLLILDEPTAVLVPQEADALFASLRTLVASGMSIVFISHKLREVLEISSRITVLRRGRVVGASEVGSVDERSLAAMMIGHELTPMDRRLEPELSVAAPAQDPAAPDVTALDGAAPEPVAARVEPPRLRVDQLSAVGAHRLPALRDVSLEIASREVMGVAGVSGNGQTELVEVLCGMRTPTTGTVEVDGKRLRLGGVHEVLGAGIGRIAEDRHATVVPDLSVAYNLVLERIDEFRRGGRLDERRIRRHADELIERFDIRARATDAARTLSGGNLQKVLLARVLAREPRVLVVSQPTRGLDVGATQYVRRELLQQRDRGAAVLLVSEDLDELLALADRLIVLYEGRVVGAMPARSANPEHLGLLMAGRSAASGAAA